MHEPCANVARRALRVHASVALVLTIAPVVVADSPFASRVIAFAPAPGQFVHNPAFNDPTRALGPPVGGGPLAPDNSKLVSLGGFGGSITLAFDHPLVNLPASSANPHGLDLIVFGNAVYVAGDVTRRWAEPGVIELSRDENSNGLADDRWFVIPGSHLPLPPADALSSQSWDDNPDDPEFPPANVAWIPTGHTGIWTSSTFALVDANFSNAVLVNPPDAGTTESVWGYADVSPTLALGDTDADGVPDDPALPPDAFFVHPDDPFQLGVSPGSAGGDAIDIDWAVDPHTGSPAHLPSIDFIRISSAVPALSPIFGERSTEISAVAEVRSDPIPDLRDFNHDGVVNPDDLGDFINAFFSADPQADFNRDGDLNPDDLGDFINAFFA